MDIPQLASRVRFVLCEPAHPGNIGSAARAIKTMGFRDLRVVAPREPGYRTHEEAVAYATSSVDVLEASRMHDTLAEALEGVTFAWALTGYDREFGPPMSPLRPAAERSVAWLDEMEGDIAFVFGTERSGMTNEEVMLCQGCAAIAADPASPSLNLAQAVQIRPTRCTWRSWPPKGMRESSTTGSPASSTSSLQALRPSRDSSATGRRP